MRILLCLSPQFRHEHSGPALESLIDRVIHKLPAVPDMAGYFSPPDRGDVKLLEKSGGRCRWIFEEDPAFSQRVLSRDYGLKPTNRLKNNLLQWHALSRLREIKKAMETESGAPYDLVIWTRPDLYFTEDLEPIGELPPNTLWISPHDNWGSYNDRFSYGDSHSMDLRLSVFEHFRARFSRRVAINRFKIPVLRRIRRGIGRAANWNAESVLGDLIRTHKLTVRRSNVLFFRVRIDEDRPYVMLPDPNGDPGMAFDPMSGSFDAERFLNALAKLDAIRTSGRVRELSFDHRPRFVELNEFETIWGS